MLGLLVRDGKRCGPACIKVQNNRDARLSDQATTPILFWLPSKSHVESDVEQYVRRIKYFRCNLWFFFSPLVVLNRNGVVLVPPQKSLTVLGFLWLYFTSLSSHAFILILTMSFLVHSENICIPLCKIKNLTFKQFSNWNFLMKRFDITHAKFCCILSVLMQVIIE